jgi:trk system potassium uptake protein TrkH
MRLPTPKRLQTNEAMVITVLIFLFAPLAMSWPMMASGLGLLDALFEAISAVTTTGLTTTSTIADKPYTFLFARAWMQWIGGARHCGAFFGGDDPAGAGGQASGRLAGL